MIAPNRIYRTTAGDLTIDEGDAAFLAYAAGDQVASQDEDTVTALLAPAADPDPATKPTVPAADKLRTRAPATK